MNEIVSALTSSSVMVLIYSKNANLSKEIERELALAGQHQLTVIPLKIDDVVPGRNTRPVHFLRQGQRT